MEQEKIANPTKLYVSKELISELDCTLRWDVIFNSGDPIAWIEVLEETRAYLKRTRRIDFIQFAKLF